MRSTRPPCRAGESAEVVEQEVAHLPLVARDRLDVDQRARQFENVHRFIIVERWRRKDRGRRDRRFFTSR